MFERLVGNLAFTFLSFRNNMDDSLVEPSFSRTISCRRHHRRSRPRNLGQPSGCFLELVQSLKLAINSKGGQLHCDADESTAARRSLNPLSHCLWVGSVQASMQEPSRLRCKSQDYRGLRVDGLPRCFLNVGEVVLHLQPEPSCWCLNSILQMPRCRVHCPSCIFHPPKL